MARTQTQKVLDWLASGKALTTRQAKRILKVKNPSALIFKLRSKGHPIKAKYKKKESRIGAKYYIPQT